MVEDRFWEQERRCVLTCFSALAPTNQRNRAEMEDREMKATQRLEDDVPKQEPIKLGSVNVSAVCCLFCTKSGFATSFCEHKGTQRSSHTRAH